MLTAVLVVVAAAPFVIVGYMVVHHFWIEDRDSDPVHEAEVDALIDEVGSAHPQLRRGAITGLDDTGGDPGWNA